MTTAALPRAGSPFARLQDLILPVGMIASVLVILVPMPAVVLDVLLASNIAIAVIILLTTIYVPRHWSSASFRRCSWRPRWHGSF